MIKTKTQTELVDDLDHSIAGGTVATRSISLGADTRHLELSDEHWNELVAILDPYLKVSRKAPKSGRRAAKTGTPTITLDAEQRAFNKRARKWAIDTGRITDARRGRLSAALADEFRKLEAGEVTLPLGEQAHDPAATPQF